MPNYVEVYADKTSGGNFIGTIEFEAANYDDAMKKTRADADRFKDDPEMKRTIKTLYRVEKLWEGRYSPAD